MEERILDGMTAVVTGASSGIGRAIARRLASREAHVFICGRSSSRLQEVQHEIKSAGGRATIASFDLKEFSRLEKFVESARNRTGRLDIMINSAGVEYPGDVLTGEIADWKEMFDINVIALLVGSRAAVRTMRSLNCEGRIVNISSAASARCNSKVYGATKHAVNVISASLRDELENDRIRITNILPGACATNFARNFTDGFIARLTGSTDISRVTNPDGTFAADTLERVQQKLGSYLCEADEIARAVTYVISQPIDMNISEMTVRPPKAFAGLA